MWVGPCVLCWIAKKSSKRTSHCSNHEFSSMASIHTSCIRLESGLQIMTTISSQVKWDMLEPIINAASWSAATWRDSIPMILLAWKAATWRSSSSDKWINITSITIIIGLISQLMGFITFNQRWVCWAPFMAWPTPSISPSISDVICLVKSLEFSLLSKNLSSVGYPLVMTNSLLLIMAIEIVDFPIKDGNFPYIVRLFITNCI